MTLQQLGELGNFLGGVLGVVALVYLAFQVRQNTVALRMNAYQESVRSANDAAALFATHPEWPFLDTPYGHDWWKRHASSLDADFRAHVEARFAALAQEAAPRA